MVIGQGFSGEVPKKIAIYFKENMAQQYEQHQIEYKIEYKASLLKKVGKNPKTIQVESCHAQDHIRAGKHQGHIERQEITSHCHLEHHNQEPETDLKNYG